MGTVFLARCETCNAEYIGHGPHWEACDTCGGVTYRTQHIADPDPRLSALAAKEDRDREAALEAYFRREQGYETTRLAAKCPAQ